MKEFSNNNDIDIGQVIGFYDENDTLQISSIFEVRDDSIVIDSNIHIAKKDIIDVIFVDLSKYKQLLTIIKELESDTHINKIKARAIEEAVEEAAIDCNVTDGPVIVLEKVRNYADKLRGKHD